MASQTKKITLDTAALFFGRAVGLLLGIVRLNYLATYLGVASFGILNFATYFTALFQSLFDLGMAQLMTREISRDPSRSGEMLGRVVVLKLFIVFVASLLVGAVTLISGFDRVTNWAVLLTTVALAINGISMMFLSAFQAHRKMVTVSVANIANDAIVSAAIILMLPSFPGVVTALSLTVLVSAINLGVLIRIYLRVVGPLEFRVDVPMWRALLKEGTPIAVSSLAISVYAFIGPTILKYTRGTEEVGIYSAGYKLISILTLIPATFSQVVFPIFSDFYKNANHKLDKALQDSLRMMSQISIPLAVGGIILAPRIFLLLYPASFTDGAFVFQVIIAGSTVGYLAQVLYTFLLATDRHRTCMWDTIVVAILVTVAGLTLIPRYGYQAVALILMVADLVLFASLLLLTVSPGKFKEKFPKLMRILGSAVLMGCLLFLIRDWYLVPVIMIATAVYFLALFLLRSFGDQETEILSKIKHELFNA